MESFFGSQINLYSLLIKQNVRFSLFAPYTLAKDASDFHVNSNLSSD